MGIYDIYILKQIVIQGIIDIIYIFSNRGYFDHFLVYFSLTIVIIIFTRLVEYLIFFKNNIKDKLFEHFIKNIFGVKYSHQC